MTKNQGKEMNETKAIDKIERLMQRLELEGHDVSSIRHFFDAGEWLIAFEGIENLKSNLTCDHEAGRDINSLRDYFSS